jgi:AcrR family transcriptional regulator
VQGLRERKKAATRQAISDVATRLFEEHGFERVTVADVADAAGVSVKTVFNYFGSKEELFFDHEDAILELLLRTLRDRAPGLTATAAMRALLLDGPLPFPGCRWSDLRSDLYEGMRAFIACERASPALSSRRLVIAQSWVAPLAEEAGSEAWAAMFVGVLNLRQAVLARALLERRAPRTVERRVRLTVGEALDALERGFPTT